MLHLCITHDVIPIICTIFMLRECHGLLENSTDHVLEAVYENSSDLTQRWVFPNLCKVVVIIIILHYSISVVEKYSTHEKHASVICNLQISQQIQQRCM